MSNQTCQRILNQAHSNCKLNCFVRKVLSRIVEFRMIRRLVCKCNCSSGQIVSSQRGLFLNKSKKIHLGVFGVRGVNHFSSVSPSPTLKIPSTSTHFGNHEILIKRLNSTNAAKENPEQDIDTSIKDDLIKDDEKATGSSEKHEFQAETRMLLDIVAKSLYSESEIFIRELISNASDALEKLRFLSLSGEALDSGMGVKEIHLKTNKQSRTFTIQDTGIGLTKEEMIEHLGTIAKSGSKEFLEKVMQGNVEGGANQIIGQFGVGFYSSFMVADKVTVYSKSSRPGSKGYMWTSDGTGTYEIQEAEHVQCGTKIVVHLKPEFRQFSDDDAVKEVIKKYSNFVGFPIYLNGTRINLLDALWLKDPKEVESSDHEQFYRFIGNTFDRPRFTLHFSTDAPLNLRCLLYFPESKPGMFELAGQTEVGVALYSRKIMIKNKADLVLPQWLRFLKGVIESEDIPLNLSRELLQEGHIVRKVKTVVVNRVLRFLYDKARKDPEEYEKFYKEYGIFLKEGIALEAEQNRKEEIAKLLKFESSNKKPGETVSLSEYLQNMQAAQKDIYYLVAPSRELADRSPYLEPLKEKNVEVLYCYEPYDELILIKLMQFDRKPITSIEKEMRQMKEDLDLEALPLGSLSKPEAESLSLWLQQTLKDRAHSIKLTNKLDSYPCVVTVDEIGRARHFVRTQKMTPELRNSLLQPRFEINVKHPLIKKLSSLIQSDPDIAKLLADQLFNTAMVTAGLEENPRIMVDNLNELLTKAFEKF